MRGMVGWSRAAVLEEQIIIASSMYVSRAVGCRLAIGGAVP